LNNKKFKSNYMIAKIKKVFAREILDSNGWPTVEVAVTLNTGQTAIAAAPTSSLHNPFEASEKRDGDPQRYFGRGVQLAVQAVNEKLAPSLVGLSPLKQEKIDQLLIDLDGTEQKEKLGASALLAVSLAVAKAAALAQGQELYEYLHETFFSDTKISLPTPLMTMFNGGGFADTNLDFQEYLLTFSPSAARFQKSARPLAEMIRASVETYHRLGQILDEAGYDVDVGSQGGYAPDLDSSIQALELISAAALAAGYENEFRLGIDIGSGSLFDENNQKYIFSLGGDYLSSVHLVGLYHDWLKRFPLVYLEDPVAASDYDAWKQISRELGKETLIVGNDFFATSTKRLRAALKDQLANAIVIVPAQVGTLTEAIDCFKLAKSHNYQIILSQRRGETNDDSLVDLAVAGGADYLKAGAPARGERISKWNRLLMIEAKLKFKA
jgi:enolase